MTVLLVGERDSAEVAGLSDALDRRDVPRAVLDPSEWPGGTEPLTVSVGTDAVPDLRLPVAVSREDVRSVYVDDRGFHLSEDPLFEQLREETYATLTRAREYKATVNNLLQTLPPDVRCLNSARRPGRVQKLAQLQLAREREIPVPPTLVTTNPDDVEEFRDRYGDVVYKPVSGGGYAHRLTDEKWASDRSRLRKTPVQFQPRVPGDDYRVYVLDGEVASAARFEMPDDEVDYRTDGTPVAATADLPASLAAAARESVDAVGMEFGGADFILSPRDRLPFDPAVDPGEDPVPVLLEVNDAPMFGRFDDELGTDTADALAEYLARPK